MRKGLALVGRPPTTKGATKSQGFVDLLLIDVRDLSAIGPRFFTSSRVIGHLDTIAGTISAFVPWHVTSSSPHAGLGRIGLQPLVVYRVPGDSKRRLRA